MQEEFKDPVLLNIEVSHVILPSLRHKEMFELCSSFTESYTFSQFIVSCRKRMHVWMKEWVKKLSGHKAWITFLAEKMDIVFSHVQNSIV